MTDLLDPVFEAQQRGAVVGMVPLARFDFKSGQKRYWPGFSPITLSGEVWTGTGDLATLSPIGGGPGQAVEEIVFTLFGGDDLLAHISEDEEESVGRDVEVLFHCFDVRRTNELGNWVEYAPLAAPITMFVGRLGPMTVKRTRPVDGRATRTVEVRAQNLFINRARAPFQFFSDRDQKARAPGDNIFVRVSQYSEGTVKWPQF